MASPSAAQDVTVDTAAADDGSPVIVVTGSRIARDPNVSAPSPISTVSIEDAFRTGTSDISEVLREIPALSGSGTVADSIEGGAGGTGQATLNLRGLGSGRTLVVVDGKRHVSGVADSQIVDVSTIPRGLIERVEVLTGGASAVYGADAVTGVVNYVLKDRFVGFEASAQVGMSEFEDGFTGSADVLYGTDFSDGRGNIVLGYGYDRTSEVKWGDRDFTRDNALVNRSLQYPNVDRRFQQGEITSSATPNFSNYYALSAGRFPYGNSIPLPGSPAYDAIFTSGVAPTPAEQALIDRAQNAPSNSFLPRGNFAISSNQSLIGRADYGGFIADVNGNGTQDCDESFVGFNFGTCYVSTPDGGARVFQDGIIAGAITQFGGDGAYQDTNDDSLVPERDQHYGVIRATYDRGPGMELFLDAKYVATKASRQDRYSIFHDPIYISPENPFIPEVLQADADDAGGLVFARDYTDLGPGNIDIDRETYRVVAGMRGDFWDNFSYELFGNWGRTEVTVFDDSAIQYDRLFAALDAVDEGEFNGGPANGNIVCRSELDPGVVPPGSDIFPFIEAGFFTFNPGQGLCAPYSPFNGQFSASPEAVAFITTTTRDSSAIEQINLGFSVVGDTESFFSLPGGPVDFVVGGEYREEHSQTNINQLDRGIFPIDTPAGPAGTFIGDVSANGSLLGDGSGPVLNSGGTFSVREIFGEVRAPILEGIPFAELLEISGQARYSDYSNVGGTVAYGVSGIYAPSRDLSLRATYSRSVRAPNIGELFSPTQPTGFAPIDPCDVNNIAARPDGDPFTANVIANCAADGAPDGYLNEATGRFIGAAGGNPDLTEETADTYTFGAVFTPTFLPGLTITGDYYNIKITDAISAVSAQDIVDNCYEASSLDNQYCGLFTRDEDTYFFNFLLQSDVNFGRIETAGVDAQIAYSFDIGDNEFNLRAGGNWTDYINRFFDPGDPDAVNPQLRENRFPEWSGTASAAYTRGPFSIRYGLQYLGEMVRGGVDVEDVETVAGPAFGFNEETFIHDVSVNYDAGVAQVFAGINNFTGEKPFAEFFAYPVNPYGRYFFLGVRAQLD